MGGRAASVLVCEDTNFDGLLLLAYPLHPPGQPGKLRIEHLPAITVPTLAISGTGDPFGTPDELVAHLDTIAAPVTYVWVDGAGHDWKGRDEQIAEVVAAWLRGKPVPERLEKSPRRR